MMMFKNKELLNSFRLPFLNPSTFGFRLLAAFIVLSGFITATPKRDDGELAALFNHYFEESLQLFPLRATSIGDTRYNDLLPAEFTDSYTATLKNFYSTYLSRISKYNRNTLSDNDRISYDIFKREMQISLEGLSLKTNRMPFNQFNGLPLTMGQLGSGDGSQPFKTVKDYDNWISRATRFSAWTDSAIIYFRKGMTENIILPKALVVKIIPQLEALQSTDAAKSLFYGPIHKFPNSFSDDDKKRLTAAFTTLINDQINPSYKKLSSFFKNEYIGKARTSSGLTGLAEGGHMYRYAIRYWTTTDKTPDELYNIGMADVKRIRSEMEKIKAQVDFKGDLKAFFTFVNTDKQFFPYKTSEEVLNDYRAIQQKITPYLPKLFGRTPKTAFEVRQTEAFRAASASAQYNRPSADGSRPGIFYVPILDATKYPNAKENLFLHEAIPGHHYQIALQQENDSLPKFRRFGGYSAYSEGWALYCESLGKELGCYSDPYQYLNALSGEIHRAIRLVVDAGMHSKGWTREQAIQYMMDNEAINEQGATAEIERYMAMPGQALSYKVGAMKIQELRSKYQKSLGASFKISDFHDELLKDGAMPLDVLERKMDAWAVREKMREKRSATSP